MSHEPASHQPENLYDVDVLAFADNSGAKYVSITGKATVDSSRARIKELWSPFAKAWWDSPEDPAIRVIRVEPQDAELWDSPGRLATVAPRSVRTPASSPCC